MSNDHINTHTHTQGEIVNKLRVRKKIGSMNSKKRENEH